MPGRARHGWCGSLLLVGFVLNGSCDDGSTKGQADARALGELGEGEGQALCDWFLDKADQHAQRYPLSSSCNGVGLSATVLAFPGASSSEVEGWLKTCTEARDQCLDSYRIEDSDRVCPVFDGCAASVAEFKRCNEHLFAQLAGRAEASVGAPDCEQASVADARAVTTAVALTPPPDITCREALAERCPGLWVSAR